MKNKAWILIVALPVALMAALLSPNEYADQGIEAVDCDGPIGVMIFAVITYVIYGIGGIVYSKKYVKAKKMFDIMALVFCLSIMAAITPNAMAAMKQNTMNQNTQECGKQR